MPHKPSDLERINHIIEAINKIFSYTEEIGELEFLKEEMVQDAVIKNFEVIGEAAYHISKGLKVEYENIPWKKMEGIRHVLVHDYYKINPEILWNTKEQYFHDMLIDLEEIVLAGNDK